MKAILTLAVAGTIAGAATDPRDSYMCDDAKEAALARFGEPDEATEYRSRAARITNDYWWFNKDVVIQFTYEPRTGACVDVNQFSIDAASRRPL